MSRTHVIDDEPQLFHFDSCDESDLLHTSTMIPSLARVNLDALELAPQTFSHDAPSTSEETFDMGDVEVIGKGKGVTRTLPIRVPTAPAQDSFNMEYFASLPSTSTGSVLSSNLLTPLTPPYFDQYSYSIEPRQQLSSHLHENAWGPAVEPSTESLGSKGKQKELPPVLPPLAFSPTELSYAPSSPSPLRSFSSSGFSSYGSSILPLTRVTSNPESQGTTSAITLLSPTTSEAPPIAHAAHRPRSLSSISVRSTRSLTARSMSQLRSRLTLSTSSNLARKLLFKKPADTQVSQYRSTTVDDELFRTTGAPDLWRTGMKLDELDATISWLSDSQTTILKSPNPFFSHTSLRHKGRSHSSPFPLSALDIVPLSTPDIFVPIPLVVRNYFDEVLPRELRLNVFEALVALHEADHLRTVRQGRWSVSKASSSRNRWVGRDKGVRELVKFSRVSKSWQALAFDGQLWAGLDLHSFPDMVESLILRFTNNAGQCIRTIDISGNSQLSAAALLDMADHFCINASSDLDSLCYTQLTGINLQGCSALTTRSLHHLLFRSPFLQKLCVKGLKAVTNSTCNILSTYNSQLISLNVSRCMNMDASGIKNMSTASLNRGAHLQLKELRMSGLRNIDDEMMAALGKAAPFLEVLDLSYARQLHNSAVDAFVACEMGEDIDQKTILVSPRDLGRSDSNGFRIQRRVTRLRHLSLSYCLLLTDDACSNLRSSVPDLEFLELGGIGADIKDDGLIRLLDTAPYIRRLDLEDAIHITDAVLSALTPSTNVTQPPLADVAPEPGHALEQLNISFAANITNNALIALIRGCTRLKHIEADNTHINSTMLKEFVRTCHQRGMVNAKANVVDCRGVTDSTVKDLAGLTRPRWGWRAHEARKLSFLDSRDGNIDELKVGQDECDEKRVVLKSFYSWQTVDNVKVAREKRRKSRRGASTESGESEIDDGVGRPLRWWSPGGRRTPAISGRNSPLNIADMNSDGCRVM
ncbi:hypothetical protein H0H87_006410 [Tephrocybe sp. NHM501043]|nr:hypothetical protein H0H87_006410 [Tephrocybe sp. NHM501043]